jgi:hypothetical protein
VRTLIRVFLAVLFCVGVAAIAVIWLLNLVPGGSRQAGRLLRSNEPREPPRRNLDTATSADAQKRAVVYDIILDKFENGGYSTAVQFMAPIRDLGSL